jgi:hypothetical protein
MGPMTSPLPNRDNVFLPRIYAETCAHCAMQLSQRISRAVSGAEASRSLWIFSPSSSHRPQTRHNQTEQVAASVEWNDLIFILSDLHNEAL